MKDNDLIRLIISIVTDGLALRSISGVSIMQSYQPMQQGIPFNQTIFISKVSDTPIGSPKRLDEWNSLTQKMMKSEIQVYETQYQIMALFPQNASTETLTASDLANTVRQILQSDECISRLLESDAQVLRVTSVRDPYFKDDRNLFEMSPSFDISFIHGQTFENEIGAVDEDNIVAGIYPI